jgi:hypothetical protein
MPIVEGSVYAIHARFASDAPSTLTPQLEKVEHSFRELGLTKNTLAVQRLFTNEVVQVL